MRYVHIDNWEKDPAKSSSYQSQSSNYLFDSIFTVRISGLSMFEVKDEHNPSAPPKRKMEIISVEMWISWFQLKVDQELYSLLDRV